MSSVVSNLNELTYEQERQSFRAVKKNFEKKKHRSANHTQAKVLAGTGRSPTAS